MPHPHLRTCTVKHGRVRFNEVIITGQPQPDVVVLAAIDPESGLHVWTGSAKAVKASSGPQHANYSRSPSGFAVDDPPSYLDGYTFFPREHFDPQRWQRTVAASTNTKNRAVRSLLEGIGFF